MPSPLLLDLFCGAGGAAVGYHQAGFRMVGVDIKPQPHYPFPFIRADAMTWPIRGVDAVHASPPCQAFTRARVIHKRAHPDLINSIRARLKSTGVPWVIENVVGAPVYPDYRLCGCMFLLQAGGKSLYRERWFETSWQCFQFRQPCNHELPAIDVFGHTATTSIAGRREAMGIDWMNRDELSEAIPPAFTEYIGRELLAHAA